MAGVEQRSINCNKCRADFVLVFTKEAIANDGQRSCECPYCSHVHSTKSKVTIIETRKLEDPRNSPSPAPRTTGDKKKAAERSGSQDAGNIDRPGHLAAAGTGASTGNGEHRVREDRILPFGADGEDEFDSTQGEPNVEADPEQEGEAGNSKPAGRSPLRSLAVGIPNSLGLTRAWRAVTTRRPSDPARSETDRPGADTEEHQGQPPSAIPDPEEISRRVVQDVQPFLEDLAHAIEGCRSDVRRLEESIESHFRLRYAAASDDVIRQLPDLFDIIENRVAAVKSGQGSDMDVMTVLNQISELMSQWRQPLGIERIPENLSDPFVFDGDKHQIRERSTDPDVEKGTEIIRNVQAYGYRLQDNTIREAKLEVAIGTRESAEAHRAPDSLPATTEE